MIQPQTTKLMIFWILSISWSLSWHTWCRNRHTLRISVHGRLRLRRLAQSPPSLFPKVRRTPFQPWGPPQVFHDFWKVEKGLSFYMPVPSLQDDCYALPCSHHNRISYPPCHIWSFPHTPDIEEWFFHVFCIPSGTNLKFESFSGHTNITSRCQPAKKGMKVFLFFSIESGIK